MRAHSSAKPNRYETRFGRRRRRCRKNEAKREVKKAEVRADRTGSGVFRSSWSWWSANEAQREVKDR